MTDKPIRVSRVPDIAEKIAKTVGYPMGIRQGEIISIQTGSVTVTVGGGTTQIAGIRYLESYYPAVGDTVYMVHLDDDLWILGAILDAADTGAQYMQSDRQAAGGLTLTTTQTDVPSSSKVITTRRPNAVCIVNMVCHFQVTTALGAFNVAQCHLNLDGVDQTPYAEFAPDGTTIGAATVPQTFRLLLATVGSYTLKMRARKTVNAGAVGLAATNTGYTWQLFD
jgi:hypothetical protein